MVCRAPDRFVAYVEYPTSSAHLRLRQPVPMRGHYLDATRRRDLGAITVAPVLRSEPSARVSVPGEPRAVIVDLRAS